MAASVGITRAASIAIDDMLDNVAAVKAGDEVVLLQHLDGVYGGDNLVDPVAVNWIQQAIVARGANPTVMWIDEVAKPHAWRIPPVVMAALKACNVFINQSFDLTIEELKELLDAAAECNVTLLRNMATTPGLLNSPWALTPYKLVSEIRYQACGPFGTGGMDYEIFDDNGTHIKGVIAPPSHPRFPQYQRRRAEGPGYRPFPEWVFPPVNVRNTNGMIVFDRMLSWWSRYIGLSPVFKNPIRLEIRDNVITKIEGKDEAETLRSFLKMMEGKLGQNVYSFPEIHSGCHPQAIVAPQQGGGAMIQRLVDHSDCCNIHFHIGAPWPGKEYPYWMHITGDLRTATWKVGEQYIHEKGHMVALDHPKVKEVAAKYPDRPGLTRWPVNF